MKEVFIYLIKVGRHSEEVVILKERENTAMSATAVVLKVLSNCQTCFKLCFCLLCPMAKVCSEICQTFV